MAGTPSRSPELSTETTLRRASLRSRRAAHPVLRCVQSPDRAIVGLSLELDGTRYEFGRATDAKTRIQDPRMSRSHFRLEPGPKGYEIIDLDTANGTFVDGDRLSGSQKFEGDVISVGDTLFVRESEVDPEHLPASSSAPETSCRGMVGTSFAARALRRSVATVAAAPGSVLLLGATGTGKEVTAQAIHEASKRPGEFVAVNCAAIPGDLAEAEFFGYVKGAFTGAEQDRPGYFEQAHGGTLFLDEVGDLPGHLQAKLLRVLEDSRVRRVGASQQQDVDVRVVAATHIDLDVSGFRRDLLARLGDWVLRLPRLAERKVDVLPLWRHFFGENGSPEMTAEFQEALLLYDWPMNIRELRKLARRVSELAPPGEPVDVNLLPRALRDPIMRRLQASSSSLPVLSPNAPTADLAPDAGKGPSRDQLVHALRVSRGNVKQAAVENGWHRTQLYRWLKRFGIDPRSYR